MDAQNREHLESLLKAHQKRLHALELKAALQGQNTPAEILIEIDDLRETIATIQAQVDQAKKLASGEYAGPPSQEDKKAGALTKKIEIVFNGNFDNVTPSLQQAVVRALAAMVEISPDQVAILQVTPGSIKVLVEMPADAAERLIHLYTSHHPLIEILGVETIKMSTASAQENIRGRQLDTQAAYALFQRAIAERDQAALNEIFQQYSPLVDSWVQRTPAFAASKEGSEYFIVAAFSRFFLAITAERLSSFPSLAALLSYLRSCVTAAIVDFVRAQPQATSPAEIPQSQALWDHINAQLQNEAESVAIHSSFHMGRTPRQIYELRPDLFSSLAEVYQVKRNVLQRLARNMPSVLSSARPTYSSQAQELSSERVSNT